MAGAFLDVFCDEVLWLVWPFTFHLSASSGLNHDADKHLRQNEQKSQSHLIVKWAGMDEHSQGLWD